MNALIKLCTGEELIADVVEFKDHLRLTHPVLVVRYNTDFGPAISVSSWLTFLKDQTIDIDRNKLVAFKYGLDDNAERHYINFVNGTSALHFNHETVERKDNDDYSDAETARRVISNLIRGESSNTTIH